MANLTIWILMNVFEQNNIKEILLFDGSCPKNARLNVLKEFIYYLKFSGKRGKIDFAFSGNEESSHPRLTIKENYILDSVPTSLIKDKEDNFNITAQNLANPHLKALIKETECVDRIVGELAPEERKLVSIVKALLSRSEFVFMDRPDMHIGPRLLKTIKEALLFECRTNKRKIFIRPDNQEKWLDLATHVVSKDESNRYLKTTNKLCSQKFRVNGEAKFELVKKAA